MGERRPPAGSDEGTRFLAIVIHIGCTPALKWRRVRHVPNVLVCREGTANGRIRTHPPHEVRGKDVGFLCEVTKAEVWVGLPFVEYHGVVVYCGDGEVAETVAAEVAAEPGSGCTCGSVGL